MEDIKNDKNEKINLPALAPETGLQKYLQEINKIPSLTQEEEYLLAKAYLEQQDLEAAQKLVTSHLKLVAKIALKYRNYGMPTNELISEGNLGLMHAVKKFKPDLGYRLSTYALWWIKASIQEYILRSWSLVKLGTTSAQKKLFFSLSKMKNKIRSVKLREINDEDYQEISDNLGLEKSEIIEMDRRLSNNDLSLNSPMGNDDDGGELLEMIRESRPEQEETLALSEQNQQRRALLSRALNELNERELLIINERKLNESPTTLDELSKRLNISKERVRQIENRAFEKMQKFMIPKID